ncbi:MAG: hypothetical protein ACOH5I_22230 [Oligoflexus sp.]
MGCIAAGKLTDFASWMRKGKDGWKAVAFHGRLPWDFKFSNPNFADDPWNLFRIEQDPSESFDLGSQYPDKLNELKVLFNEQALKYNVYPLSDSTGKRVAESYASFTAGKDFFAYTQEDGNIHEALSPPVKNRSHTISVRLGSVAADGVIVAVGGRFGGYSLFVQDKRMHYTHNFIGDAQYDIVASEDLPDGPVNLRFKFEKTGEYQGIGKLYIDDRLVGQGELPKLTPIMYSPYDTFDISEDSGSPVSSRYESPFPYSGIIEHVEVKLN